MARTKLTPEVQRRIVDAIAVGATYGLACHYGGIHIDTFDDWRKRGERERARLDGATKHTEPLPTEEPFLRFSEAVKEAEGRAAVKWLAQIDKAAQDGTWQAAAWKLERRYPELYGRTVTDHYRREAVERIAREEGVDPARLYDLAFEREKRRAG